MYKRIGKCKAGACGKCCKSFSLLGSAYESFRQAQKKYDLKLIRNSDGTYRCNMLDTKTKLCKIHRDKPRVCKDAPRVPFPSNWHCGYRFIEIRNHKKERKNTMKAIHLLEELKPAKVDFWTQEILNYGRRYLSEVSGVS